MSAGLPISPVGTRIEKPSTGRLAGPSVVQEQPGARQLGGTGPAGVQQLAPPAYDRPAGWGTFAAPGQTNVEPREIAGDMKLKREPARQRSADMDTDTARQLWELPLAERNRALLANIPGFQPSKRLGQSFLANDAAAERVAAAVAELDPPGVVEIGGGLGALTVPILRHLPKARVIVYEIDERLCRVLAELLSPASRRCMVVCADFLQSEPAEIGAADDWVVAGSIPYSITTPILEKIFSGPPRWSAAVLMVQREFAERLMAGPGSRTYGALSIFAWYHCEEILRLMKLQPGSFWPRPEVSSVVLLLRLRLEPPAEVRTPAVFFEIVRSAFGHRRKTIFRALTTTPPLGASPDQIHRALDKAGIDANARPEQLSPENFAKLATALVRAVKRR
ncbi:MAG: ribosomal RNA small subunit methyltransferase A [Armatimonadetes bacterium]|nr:ribosomal RNA small subunit methyltransferase A [Armatimonadota bacterium]